MKKNHIHLRTDVYPEKVQQNGQTILIAENSNGKSIIRSDQKLCMVAELSREIIAQDYHQKYSHIPLQAFKHIQEAPQWLHTYKMKECEACIQGKFRKPDSPTQPAKQRQIMSIAFSDVQEMSTTAYNGAKYNCILVEGATGFITNTTIKTKSAAGDAVINMIQWMENATGKKLQSLKTDHGGEYRSHKFLQQLKERGIQLVENVPYHSETKSVAERANLTISTMARTAHLHSKVPKKYWPEAFGHAIFTKNRIPHKSYSCPPAEAFLGSNVENERGRLRPFGEPVWIHDYQANDKLESHAIKARIVGYGVSYKTYRVMLENGRITTALNPRKRELISQQPPIEIEHPTISVDKPNESVQGPKLQLPEPIVPNREIRTTAGKPPQRYGWMAEAMIADITVSNDEAEYGKDHTEWAKAKEKELEQLQKYEIYEEVTAVPEGKPVVDTKWVFRKKERADGTIKFKARITGRGFTQIAGESFDRTDAPTARPESWKTMIALALRNNYMIEQFDVVAAYLQAPLHHEIYVCDPQITGKKAWKLKKALYGLKQSAHEWNPEMTGIMTCRVNPNQK
jgi:transposase InsO family protein